MTKRLGILVVGIATLFLLAATNPTSAKTSPTTVPAQVADLQAAVQTWIDGLRGKTEAEITQSLGKDCERTRWQSGHFGGLKLTYRLGAQSKLHLMFNRDHVVYADLTMTSSD